MPDPNDEQMEAGFQRWIASLPKIDIDGEQLFVVHGDELKDETQARELWRKMQKKKESAPPRDPAAPLEFLDISADPTPKNKTEDTNQRKQ